MIIKSRKIIKNTNDSQLKRAGQDDRQLPLYTGFLSLSLSLSFILTLFWSSFSTIFFLLFLSTFSLLSAFSVWFTSYCSSALSAPIDNASALAMLAMPTATALLAWWWLSVPEPLAKVLKVVVISLVEFRFLLLKNASNDSTVGRQRSGLAALALIKICCNIIF